MRRLALPATVALLTLLCAGTPSAARTITPVRGDVRALAFGGDALVVARQPAGRGLLVERMVPGAPASVIVRTKLTDDDDQVALAASPEALAFAFNPDDDAPPAAVMVGPAAGPLREVAACTTGLLVSPVAVAGSRIAWREGGCGEPADRPRAIGPSAIVVGGADPGAPVRRSPVDGSGMLTSLVLGPGDAGFAGVLLPSFFLLDGEVRPFGPAGVGAPVVTERGRAVSPAGILGDGTRVLALSAEAGGESESCMTEVATIAPGASARRTIQTGVCASGEDDFGAPSGVSVTADRIVMRVAEPPPSSDARMRKVFVVSVRGDGGDRRVLARGGYRVPLGVAAEGDRSAWWQERCTAGSELVVQDQAESGTLSIAPCRVEIRTRRARVRDGRVAVRLRCPAGCSGNADGARLGRGSNSFEFGPGSHVLRLPVSLGRQTRLRLRLDLTIRNGPSRRGSIRVRR